MVGNDKFELDVISVGDIVTDAFIKLIDEEAVQFTNEDGRWLAVPFGTKIPFDHAEVIEAVGNSANASVCFARLGLKSALYANIGDDSHGRDMISALNKQSVDTRFIRINPKKHSNYHYVLWHKDERTILIKHEEYDYHWPHLRPKEIPKWIYFISISKNAIEFHDDLADWLDENPQVKLAFQPGTFQIEAGTKRLARIYKRADVLIVNKEEAAIVTNSEADDIHHLLDKLHSLGPKIVSVSDGPKGAYASDGNNRYKMPLYPDPKPPLERTGAGDAFTATFVAALMHGSSLEGALLWAPINSMSVVQEVGAQKGLLTAKELSKYLKDAPSDYRPVKMS